jgi:hypothetical protein
MWAGIVLFREELAYLRGGGLGGVWTCDSGFNDGREMEDFFALELVSGPRK